MRRFLRVLAPRNDLVIGELPSGVFAAGNTITTGDTLRVLAPRNDLVIGELPNFLPEKG